MPMCLIWSPCWVVESSWIPISTAFFGWKRSRPSAARQRRNPWRKCPVNRRPASMFTHHFFGSPICDGFNIIEPYWKKNSWMMLDGFCTRNDRTCDKWYKCGSITPIPIYYSCIWPKSHPLLQVEEKITALEDKNSSPSSVEDYPVLTLG